MENTAKNFALQLGSLIALYVSIGALITLLFGIITIEYPDAAQGMWEYESASSSIRSAIALLVVFFPTYLILTRLVNTIRRVDHGVYLTLTKWLIYISLLVGGGVILGDLVTVLNSFLNGELTTRFILKALTVFGVVGVAFLYYVLDARNYWQDNEKKSIQYAGAALLLVVLTVVFGFRHTEAPAEVREMKIDTQQVNDLQSIQYRIEEHYRINSSLPKSIKEMYVGLEAPTAPEDRAAYTYTATNASKFELCAEFAYPSSKTDQMQYAEPMYSEGMIIKNPYNWEHSAGEWCFERVVSVSEAVVPVQKI